MMSTLFRRSSQRATKPIRRQLVRLGPLVPVAMGVVILFPAVGAEAAQAPIGLGAAGSFAVLAGSGITNTGATTVNGDMGTFPTPSETGFGSVTLTGTNHAGDAVTQQAKTDLTTSYQVAAGSGPGTSVPTELGGRTLTPGVYSGPTLGITGTLTLNTLGDPSAVFIFQAASTLITSSTSAVTVLNGGTACNVFWQVGSSATIGTDSHLIGSVLALTSITATTGATISGRLLARNGAVTLDHNTITTPTCAVATSVTTTISPGPKASGTNTGGSNLGGGSSTTTPGGAATTPPGNGLGSGTTPGLPLTGFDPRLPFLVGGLLVAFGIFLLGVSSRRSASR